MGVDVEVHELKTDPKVYDDVMSGRKTFEIRFNDRDFKVGDYLLLRKTYYTGEEMKQGKPLKYLDDAMVRVTYLLKGPIYGLKAGWVIMGVEH